MPTLVLDFETYYDSHYTLSKLTTEEYVRDMRFEALCVGVYDVDTGRMRSWGGNDIVDGLAAIDWTATTVICHHAQFDALILAHRYGIRPKNLVCTLSMARLVLGNTVRVGLAALAARFELATKTVPYDLFKGRRWAELTAPTQHGLVTGCLDDCKLTWEVFLRLAPAFPAEEYRVVDMTVRMFSEPTLAGDAPLLEKVAGDDWILKKKALDALDVTEAQLASADQFVRLLEECGEDVEYKSGKNGHIPAVAKNDGYMQHLSDGYDGRASELARARLEIKSTIDGTRAARLARMARRGALCVYLHYCGAQTLRWSGGDALNFQNLPRLDKTPLRRGLRAPAGQRLVIVDLSQIEARLVAWLADHTALLRRFAAGEDPYLPLASAFYGERVDKADKARRGMGKLGVLSCGYGSGAKTIARTARAGTYGPPIELTDEQALVFRDVYRAENWPVPRLWKRCDQFLSALACEPPGSAFAWKCFQFGPGYIQLPNGARMLYELEWDHWRDGDPSWFRKTRSGWKRIWGGVLLQNLCEALGRLLVSQAMIRVQDMTGHRPVMSSHDEVVWCVPEARADAMLVLCEAEMTRVPGWLPGMPLACEGHTSEVYDK